MASEVAVRKGCQKAVRKPDQNMCTEDRRGGRRLAESRSGRRIA
jgi:hypothetical protein